MIDPKTAMVPSRASNQRFGRRISNAAAASDSTTIVLGAMACQSPALRLAPTRVSTLGPKPNARSAASPTAAAKLPIASIDVTRGTQKPTPIKASPQAANPTAEAGGVGNLADNTPAELSPGSASDTKIDDSTMG